MNKYKIAVYAICKNESKFIKRWYESVKEADQIYVLDTGSTDNSTEILSTLNINYKIKNYKDFRFDIARNDALNMIPKDYDICISIDIDEILTPGWRELIEKNWKENTTAISYTFNWKITNNIPEVSFLANKIHSRNDYIWINPVHEVLKNINNNENIIIIEELTINHYPDENKSRKSYLPLLELSVKENPKNDRNMHYLGREYMYYQKYNKGIKTLKKHLSLESATWKDERAASMRFIGRMYKYKGNYKEALIWYDKAINEAPYLRDAYIEKALLYYELNDSNNIIKSINEALKIKRHQKTYINEIFSWNETPYDLLSIAYFNNKDYINALINVDKALQINNCERIRNNQKLILDKL